MLPVDCMAMNIYYEAATEPFAGKVAVAQVTLNRATNAGGYADICDVVYARKVNPATGKKVAAFSWTLGARWRAPGPKDPTVYAECLSIARRMLDGTLESVLIGPQVLSYHAVYVHPNWHKQVAAKIGRHIFYIG